MTKRAISQETAPPDNADFKDCVYKRGQLTIHFASKTVTVGERVVPIKEMEFRYLAYLALHPGKLKPQDTIHAAVYADKTANKRPTLRNLVAHINNIRRKFRIYANGQTYIESIPRHDGFLLPASDIDIPQDALEFHRAALKLIP